MEQFVETNCHKFPPGKRLEMTRLNIQGDQYTATWKKLAKTEKYSVQMCFKNIKF